MRKNAIRLSLLALLIIVGITALHLFAGIGKDCVDLTGCRGIKGCDAYYWESAPSCKIWCYAIPPEGNPGTIVCTVIDP